MGYIYYCPRCGCLIHETQLVNFEKQKCDCKSFNSVKFKKSNVLYEDIVTNNKPKYSFRDYETYKFTQDMCEFIWSNYVNIPSNKKFDPYQFFACDLFSGIRISACFLLDVYKTFKQEKNLILLPNLLPHVGYTNT